MHGRYENKAAITGIVCTPPVYVQSIRGKRYYATVIEARRLSDNTDRINTLISGNILSDFVMLPGDKVSLAGCIKTFNNKSGIGSRLRIVFVAEEFAPSCEEENHVVLAGNVCKQPIYRQTPLGREICDIMVAIPDGSERADFLPCIAWGKSARMLSCLHVKQPLRLEGRIQSRDYVKKMECSEEIKTAYEISVTSFQILA